MGSTSKLEKILFWGSTAVGLFGLFYAISLIRGPALKTLPSSELVAAHNGNLSSEEINDLRGEFANSFEFTNIGFEERPFEGKYVNKLNDRSRFSSLNKDCRGEPQGKRVWILGGSTAYGYGLPDDQTIPSQLAKLLKSDTGSNWCVKNYARGYYYSSQELDLLVDMLRTKDEMPDYVVFLDGYNDFYHLVGSSFVPNSVLGKYDPLTNQTLGLTQISLKILGKIQRWLNSESSASSPHVFGVYKVLGLKRTIPLECAPLIQGGSITGVQLDSCLPYLDIASNRILKNWEMADVLSQSVGAKFLPFLQPISLYPANSINLNPFITDKGGEQHELSKYGYPILRSSLTSSNADLSELFVDDAKSTNRQCKNYYVDLAHYNKCGSYLIANQIKKQILDK